MPSGWNVNEWLRLSGVKVGVTRVKNLPSPPPHSQEAVPNAGAHVWGQTDRQTAARLRDGVWVDGLFGIGIDTGVLWLPAAEEKPRAFELDEPRAKFSSFQQMEDDAGLGTPNGSGLHLILVRGANIVPHAELLLD